jgi:hypothetical protein
MLDLCIYGNVSPRQKAEKWKGAFAQTILLVQFMESFVEKRQGSNACSVLGKSRLSPRGVCLFLVILSLGSTCWNLRDIVHYPLGKMMFYQKFWFVYTIIRLAGSCHKMRLGQHVQIAILLYLSLGRLQQEWLAGLAFFECGLIHIGRLLLFLVFILPLGYTTG